MQNYWQMFTATLGSASVIAGVAMVYFSIRSRSKLHKNNKTLHRIITALLFGILSIYASVSAVTIDGAMCNCRNLAPLYAGLVGGPIPGIGAALIGGLFRYFVYGGPTALPCMLACFVAGIVGSIIHLVVKKNVRYNLLTGIIASVITEGIHIMILLLFGFAELAKLVAFPIIISDVLGMMFCLYIYKCFGRDDEEEK